MFYLCFKKINLTGENLSSYILVGFGIKNPHQIEGFGDPSIAGGGGSTKDQILHLIRSIRTVMKCKN